MGELKVKVNEQTERMFRRAAMHEFGYQKGAFSLAAEQALAYWASRHENMDRLRILAAERMKDPVRAMTGILKHVKKNSVELKHEISEARASRRRHISH